ncbi:Protein CBG12963 [Caenorhabditis briggsae]|uniref:Protein CBG12963 n=1 Tax=Caenorhabditis briggsae TaxID=6238 RepID=A8XGS2_CAEBR|nr:Protein CBG12963 [Caenorhabditis briggsae]CAP31846.1 Protein CBG12963 [Caenorhabditis briggsae]
MPLPFSVISTTSEDVLEGNDSDEEHETFDINWISAKNYSFPQSMVLELEEESLVSSVKITVHKDYPPSSLTVSLGIPSNHFRNSRGKSYNADYSVRQELSFRDDFHVEYGQRHPKATVFLNSPAKFVSDPFYFFRISIHGFSDSDVNHHRQVSILSVVICGAGEILPFDRNFKDEPKQKAMSYVELDRGILLPLKAKPKMREPKTIVGLYDTDSEDEEILFSKEMLNRLRKKEAVMKNPQLPSTSAITEAITVDTNSEKSAPVYFGSRMSEFNNMLRLLERKREESIWEEKYAQASAMDESVKDLKAREAGLRELIIEREDALKGKDLIAAQR